MSLKLTSALLAFLFTLGGCAQNASTVDTSTPEKGDSAFLKGRNTQVDELYINPDSAPDGRTFREVYLAPINLANIQIIQPEGVTADEEWQISDVEDGILQNAMAREFSTQLGFESAYNIVDRRSEADMIIHTTIVAIHPYGTKAESAAGAKKGGAITISLALINAETGQVMVRTVDTKSTDNIWAFNQIDGTEEAVNVMFRTWGNSMRRGLLKLQGRSNDPLDMDQPLQLKEQ